MRSVFGMLFFWCCAHWNFIWRQLFPWSIVCLMSFSFIIPPLSVFFSSLSFCFNHRPFVEMNNTGPLLVDQRRAVVRRGHSGLDDGHGRRVYSRRQSLQQRGGLLLVLLPLALQGTGQPALYRFLHLWRGRRFCQRVGFLAGVEALHHLLHVDVDGGVGACQAATALVVAQGEAVEEGLGAELAAVGAVAAAVEAAVQLQVDVLGELGVAHLALVWFFPGMEAEVCF